VTHSELCLRAQRWLRSVGCGITAVDLATIAGEQPDVIGWRYGLTVLCEVKVSRGDFLADRKKPWRARPEIGMGDWRFYVAPAGMLQPDEIPEGWGLLEWDEKRLQPRHNVPPGNMWGSPPFAGHKRHEALILCSLIRRLERPKSDRRKASKAAQRGEGEG
jgi:hypothetical protein